MQKANMNSRLHSKAVEIEMPFVVRKVTSYKISTDLNANKFLIDIFTDFFLQFLNKYSEQNTTRKCQKLKSAANHNHKTKRHVS